jgi:hypothetical protein
MVFYVFLLVLEQQHFAKINSGFQLFALLRNRLQSGLGSAVAMHWASSKSKT